MLHDTLRGLGDDWKVDDDLLDGCEMFICAVYVKAKFDSVNKVRNDLDRFPLGKACHLETCRPSNLSDQDSDDCKCSRIKAMGRSWLAGEW